MKFLSQQFVVFVFAFSIVASGDAALADDSGAVSVRSIKGRSAEQAAAVKKLESLGFRVTFHKPVKKASFVTMRCGWFTKKMGTEGMPLLKHFPNLQELSFERCGEMTDASLQHLKGSVKLRKLLFADAPKLTGAGIAHLTALVELEELRLAGSDRLKIKDLQCLKGLKKLVSLDLVACAGITSGVDDLIAGCPSLRKCRLLACHGLTHFELEGSTSLVSLEILNCRNFRGLELVNLPKLSTLKMFNCRNLVACEFQKLPSLLALSIQGDVIGKSLSGALLGLPGLKQLHLIHCETSIPNIFRDLRGSKNLESLLFVSGKFGKDGFKDLPNLPKLKTLTFRHSRVPVLKLTPGMLKNVSALEQIVFAQCSPQVIIGEEHLKKILPKCRFVHEK